MLEAKQPSIIEFQTGAPGFDGADAWNASKEPAFGEALRVGLIRLRTLISILRKSAAFTDEEGDFTNDLDSLVAALSTPHDPVEPGEAMRWIPVGYRDKRAGKAIHDAPLNSHFETVYVRAGRVIAQPEEQHP